MTRLQTCVLTGQSLRRQTDVLSWTMHAPLRKFPWSAKFLLKTSTTLLIFATIPLSHADRIIQDVRLQDDYAETLWNKQNVTSQVHCPSTRTAWRLNAAPSLSRRLVVVGKTCTCKCKLGVVSKPLGKAKD